MKFDIVITNGTVIDGTGRDAYSADIGITGESISQIGDLTGHKAPRILDAKGKFVSPGFIDIMSHVDNYWSIFEYPDAESFLQQGVTSAIGGNCGSSLAPIVSPKSILAIQKWTDTRKISVQWSSFAEYMHFLDQLILPINFGSLVGHSTLRRGFLGDEVRGLKPSEMESLLGMLDESIESGAFGLSTGLGYAHEEFAPPEELEAFAKVVRKHDALYSTHIRNEGPKLLQAVGEALDIAKNTDARVEIAHLKAKGQSYWQAMNEVLVKIQEVLERGHNVGFDLYPYHTTLSVLYAYLPDWSYEGGHQHLLDNIRGKITRKRMIADMQKSSINFSELVVAKADGLSTVIGKTFEQLAEIQGATIFDAVLDTIESARGRLLVFDQSMQPETVERLMFHHAASIATDDGYYDTDKVIAQNELVHPRSYGTFPKFLELVRLTKKISYEDAIYKITGRAATRLGLKTRGILEVGKMADIVVFDPGTVGSAADFQNPFVPPVGIEAVLVNGKVACINGKITYAGSGRTLRFGSS